MCADGDDGDDVSGHSFIKYTRLSDSFRVMGESIVTIVTIVTTLDK
jgi:hypothetical protein